MDNITEIIRYMNTANYQSLIIVIVFITTVLIIVGIVLWIMFADDPTQRRLREITQGPKLHSRKPHKEGVFDVSWFEPLVRLVLPEENWRESRIKTRLVLAGHRSSNAIKTFLILKVLLVITLPLFVGLPLIFLGVISIDDPTKTIPYLLLPALVGYYLPNMVIYRQTNSRQLLFIEGFPDAMDMMVVCVEAGLGVDAAIVRVADEIGISHPELAREFNLVGLELRAGKTREQALRSLGERTGVTQVQSLAALLIQAEHFGTSIARALREHAVEMRNMRMQAAKENAAKLPVKLIFPLVFFIFPALFLVILAPAVIRIYTGFIIGFGSG